MNPSLQTLPMAELLKLGAPGPWEIGCSNEVMGDGEGGEAFAEWLNIIGRDHKVICELPGHSQYARGSDFEDLEDANAEIITRWANHGPELSQSVNNLIGLIKSDPILWKRYCEVSNCSLGDVQNALAALDWKGGAL